MWFIMTMSNDIIPDEEYDNNEIEAKVSVCFT